MVTIRDISCEETSAPVPRGFEQPIRRQVGKHQDALTTWRREIEDFCIAQQGGAPRKCVCSPRFRKTHLSHWKFFSGFKEDGDDGRERWRAISAVASLQPRTETRQICSTPPPPSPQSAVWREAPLLSHPHIRTPNPSSSRRHEQMKTKAVSDHWAKLLMNTRGIMFSDADQIKQWSVCKLSYGERDMNFWNFTHFSEKGKRLLLHRAAPAAERWRVPTAAGIPQSASVFLSVSLSGACGVVDKISTDPGSVIVWVTIASDCRAFPSSAAAAAAEEEMFITGR